MEADAFLAAFRLPNVLQNLLGEGSLSASFIPVYSRLLASGDREGARRVAGAVAGLLGSLVGLLVAGGILFAPILVDLLTPGFSGPKRELTIHLVRVLFPGTGLLVMGAWCLGILNSHHRFFVSYAAPVAWNLAIVAAILIFGPGAEAGRVATIAAFGAVAGSALQLSIQLPGALRAAGGVRLSLDWKAPATREVGRTFMPAALSRGVAQVSAWVDLVIASLLPTGAVAGLVNAQLLYTLPVSLFGMSIAASELPAMSRESAGADRDEALRRRVAGGLERVAFFVVPSAAAFLGLGHLIAGLVFQSGRFTQSDARFVWAILAGSAIGLLAATFARIISSALFALGDTRTPLRCALVRVSLATMVGFSAAKFGPGMIGVEARWGVAGLTLAGGLAAWVEFALLRSHLHRRIGSFGLPLRRLVTLWGAAAAGVVAAWGGLLLLPTLAIIPAALLGLGLFGITYLGLASLLGVPQVAEVIRSLRGPRSHE